MFYENTGYSATEDDDGVVTSPDPVHETPGLEKTHANITPLSRSIPRQTSVIFTPPDFDVLFENPRELHFGISGESIDEGIYSFDSGLSPLSIPDEKADNKPEVGTPKTLSRGNSVMALSFTQILLKNMENSQGLKGFRHRMASDINDKYCSYCRCDDLIFIFLYVVFGIVYICAGTLSLTQCSSEQYVNAFLIVDGILSVFVFPVTIMEWTKRIGGCVKKEAIHGHGIVFIVIVILRLAAAALGSVVIAMRIDLYQRDDLMCSIVFTLLEVGVVLEWAFLLFVLLLPLLLYIAAYYVAQKL